MKAPRLKLISFNLCPFVQRARIALEEKELEHEIEYIDLDMPPDWFFDISPMEKVPVLLVDDKPLFESMVICEFIDDISGNTLYPKDPFKRAQQRAWIALGDTMLGSVFNLKNASTESDFKRAKAAIIDKLDVLEEEMTDGPYFAGKQFGMVDIAYAPLFRILTGITRYTGINFYADVPNVSAWAEQLLATPAVKASVPDDFERVFEASLKRPDTAISKMIK